MQTKLKACPFCGGTADFQQAIDTFDVYIGYGYKIGCYNHKCKVNPKITGYDKEKLIIRWNTRQ
jgi:hypothetical protein